MFIMPNGFGIPFPPLFPMQTHQAVLGGISILLLHFGKRIRLSYPTRHYYGNVIYKLTFTELFDTDR